MQKEKDHSHLDYSKIDKIDNPAGYIKLFLLCVQYALALMVLHPEVQQRLHEELDRVAEGRDHITMKDQSTLPYFEATLNEIWRYCNVAPLNPPRRGVYEEYTVANAVQK